MPSDEVPRLNTSKLPSIQTNSLLNNSLKNDQPTSYFSPISPVQLPHPTFSSPSKTVGERVGGATTPSILLNRNPSVNANTLSTLMNDAAHMQGVKRYTLVDRGTAPITVAGGNVVGGGGAGEGMKNRIGSPDSSSGYTSSSTTTSTTTATTSSTSDPSQSHLAGGGGTKSSSSPSESVSTLLGVTGLGGRDERGRDKIRDGGPMTMSRSASPHCHFAPLPRVASIGERPASSTSRRGSVSNTATNARTKLVNHDEPEPFAIDLSSASDPIPTTTTIISSTILSPRPLTPAQNPAIPPFRSPSRSPSLSRPASAQSTHNITPPLSRKPSTDAVSHHYIEARRATGSRDRRGTDASENNSSSRERESLLTMGLDTKGEVMGFDAMRSRESAAWREFPNAAPSASNSVPASPSVDMSPASFMSPATASPNMATSTTKTGATAVTVRRTLFSELPAAELERTLIGGRCRPAAQQVHRRASRSTEHGREEVVDIEPPVVINQNDEDPDEADEDNVDQEEEEEDENDESDENEDSDEREDQDGEEEGNKTRDEEGDDEEDLQPQEVRATSRGAGIEVVHWSRQEEDVID